MRDRMVSEKAWDKHVILVYGNKKLCEACEKWIWKTIKNFEETKTSENQF